MDIRYHSWWSIATMRGLLLVNLGSPQAPTPKAVRSYLKEFLSDPRVIDINSVGRAALLNLFILPTRPRKSAAAYQEIWTERGSPLIFHTEDLTAKVQTLLGANWQVKMAMRYGQPSLENALHEFRQNGIDEITVFPLYPHYASSSTGSTVERVWAIAKQEWNTPYLSIVPAFYDHPSFIDAFVEVAQPVLREHQPDHVLFSYHGLPERQVKKSDEGNHCFENKNCCDQLQQANRNCYRAQCFATTRALVAKLGIDNHSVGFQSRLGRTPWIQPYTDHLLDELPKQGVKKLAVFCPSFVADCLETLEEIGIRAKEQFTAAGGDDLVLIPSLNSSDMWAQAVASMVK